MHDTEPESHECDYGEYLDNILELEEEQIQNQSTESTENEGGGTWVHCLNNFV